MTVTTFIVAQHSLQQVRISICIRSIWHWISRSGINIVPCLKTSSTENKKSMSVLQIHNDLCKIQFFKCACVWRELNAPPPKHSTTNFFYHRSTFAAVVVGWNSIMLLPYTIEYFIKTKSAHSCKETSTENKQNKVAFHYNEFCLSLSYNFSNFWADSLHYLEKIANCNLKLFESQYVLT